MAADTVSVEQESVSQPEKDLANRIPDVAAVETQRSAHSSGASRPSPYVMLSPAKWIVTDRSPAYGVVFVEPGALWSKCSCLRTISRMLSESVIGPSSAASWPSLSPLGVAR
jgi:hypothetical protein